MQTIGQDLRYGARMLFKQPGFTLVAVLTLALGIGANTAIFSVIYAVLLKPLPFPNQARIVAVGAIETPEQTALGASSYLSFLDFQAQSAAFERMAAYSTRGFVVTTDAGAMRLRGVIATADLFPLLGVRPLHGRTFLPNEDKPGGGRVAVLSYAFWQNRFGGKREIIGQAVPISGESYTIVGVMPPGLQFPLQADPIELWTNYAKDGEDNGANSTAMQRGNQYLNILGLLKPGAAQQEAGAQLTHISAQLAEQYPNDHRASTMRALPLLQTFTGEISASLWVIFAAVCCVLLIACANVANLLLARASQRRRELAVRAALGAGRGRLLRQLLTESFLLAALGALAGCLLAAFLVDALIVITPEDIPRLAEAQLNGKVLLFTSAVAVLTGLLVGLLPAWQATRTDLQTTLKEGGRFATGGRTRARGAMIVAEVALSVVLLVAASLLLRSFAQLTRTSSGFQTAHLLTMRVALPEGIYQTANDIAPMYQRIIAALEGLPGVSAYSAVTPTPLTSSQVTVGFNIAGRPNRTGLEHPYETRLFLVGTDYWRTMGLAIQQGREFTARDDRQSQPVVMVNESFVKKFFPDENPLNHRINPTIQAEDGPLPMREIIGVVSDARSSALSQSPVPEVYLHIPQLPGFNVFTLALRTTAEPQSMLKQVQQRLVQLDRNIPVGQMKLFDEYLAATIAEPRFNSLMLTLFAAVALLLTAIGLYGVVAYSVTQRTQEIGIRMALGAQARDVLRMVIQQGMTLVLGGVGLGLLAAFGLMRLLRDLLFGIAPTDPLSLLAAAALLSAAALLACWIPARRATKVDPMNALRCE
jgi:putative ABC transport system permease protein